MSTIRTEIEIEASADAVWAVLTDFDAYPDWNPFIVSIRGPVEPGGRLSVRLAPPEGHAITMRPKLVALDAPHELRWLGRLGVPGIFDGEHRFEIVPTGSGRVRLVQSETFRGVLVRFLRTTLRRTERGFGLMNAALKARVEVQAPTLAAATRAATSTGSQTGENGGA